MFRTGLALAAIGLVWTSWPAPGDRAYPGIPRGSRPRYHHGPQAAIDLGHWNTSPWDSRLLGLADLLTWDGYRVDRFRQPLVPELIEDARVLVIAAPLAYPAALRPLAQAVGRAARPAFSPEEVAAVRDWVTAGGGLLLAPNVDGSSQASASLAAAFGLKFHECPAAAVLPETTVGQHPALSGVAPEYDLVSRAAVTASGWIEAPANATPLVMAPDAASGFCAPGKPLAAALDFGKGRVVAISAQLESHDGRSGNRQLMLNFMHWLSRAAN